MEAKNCPRCHTEYNQLDKQRLFLPCGDTICMACFETTFEADNNSLMCEPCGDHVLIPVKLRDNVQKLKAESKTVWITCDHHKGLIAMYYWHPEKKLACWDCFVKNGWPTNKMVLLNSDSVDEYCQRLLQIIVELRSKAKKCALQI